jgi:hypothetical protein
VAGDACAAVEQFYGLLGDPFYGLLGIRPSIASRISLDGTEYGLTYSKVNPRLRQGD